MTPMGLPLTSYACRTYQPHAADKINECEKYLFFLCPHSFTLPSFLCLLAFFLILAAGEPEAGGLFRPRTFKASMGNQHAQGPGSHPQNGKSKAKKRKICSGSWLIRSNSQQNVTMVPSSPLSPGLHTISSLALSWSDFLAGTDDLTETS